MKRTKFGWATMIEPTIIVNGTKLTSAQSMTVRVALTSFGESLIVDGLGEDDHGKAMSHAYLDRIREIFGYIRPREPDIDVDQCPDCGTTFNDHPPGCRY